jgi:serine/threonine protein phosphatase PrpC
MIKARNLALQFRAAAKTHIGRVRRTNQDSFGCDDALGLYVVCDGMGGAAGGDIASQIASETFLATARVEFDNLRNSNSQASCVALQRAAAAANRAVVERSAWDIRYRGMGSTLVAFRILEDQLTVIHVGDSRCYLVRNGNAMQLTEDHSFVAEQLRRGLITPAEAEASAKRSVITRAIGAEPDVRPDVQITTLQPGDTLLLASDGLTRHVEDSELAAILSVASASPAELCGRLIDLANGRGGSDNITTLIVKIDVVR